MPSARSVPRILAVFVVLAMGACSSAARHKILDFFFDGVPEPEIKLTATYVPGSGPARQGPLKAAESAPVSQHSDFRDHRCAKCHDTAAANYLSTDKRKICFVCHAESAFRAAYIHGPVAVGACLNCHLPHESPFRRLLATEANGLCTRCHKSEALSTGGAHGRDKDALCLGCHLPHASENKFFLKDSS